MRSRSDHPNNVDAHPWHALDGAHLEQELRTSLHRGLTEDEVIARRAQFGQNVITQRRGRSPLIRFLLQFHTPLVHILLVATVVTLLLHEWLDSAVIFGVVIVNAIVGFIQESKAVKAIEALARSMTTEAQVLRSGQRRRIQAEELVPGDVVILDAGEKVPADVRLVSERDLHTDESMLTGESLPISKRAAPMAQETPLADRVNMAYASTLVTRGHGIGLVVATGDRTEVGRISGLIETAEQIDTPLTRKIAHFSFLLMWFIIAVAAAMFLLGMWRGMPLVDTFLAAVALAVGAIPEGLPAAMTIMLAIGVSRMAARRAIIRKLPAVEALGSTTVICSDKTGTLTQNQMTVQKIVAGGERFEVTGVGYAPTGEIRAADRSKPIELQEHAALRECLLAGALCNDASLAQRDGTWVIQGDPTEAALVVVAHKAGLIQEEQLATRARIDAIPFESERQFMATLHATSAAPVVYVKGSVERVLSMCGNACSVDGGMVALDRESVQNIAAELAAGGLRILAVARMDAPPGANEVTHEMIDGALTFLGLQGMQDPPRPEAITAVAQCRSAGVTVKMITGDHAATALSIARTIGIGAGDTYAEKGRNTVRKEEPHEVVTSTRMSELTDAELPEIAERVHVFARMTPEQKLRLVKALQTRGHVVAMTGDGVNDAPALRQADIGVAMGISGTEVAKQAADMVLADDNFASIEAAVEEGRTVFDNLTKFLVWTLPTNGGEALIILAAILLGQQLPILPVHALYINMTTAVLLGMTLAFEPKEDNVMARPPRQPSQPILTFELLMRTGLMSLLILAGGFGLFEWAKYRGMSIEQARTVAVSLVVFAEMFYLFNCRSLVDSIWKIGWFTNRWLWLGVGVMTVVQVIFIHTPLMNRLFQSQPLDAPAWAAVIGAALLIAWIVALEKFIRRVLARRGTLQMGSTSAHDAAMM